MLLPFILRAIIVNVGAAIGRPHSRHYEFAEVWCGNEPSAAGRALLAPTVLVYTFFPILWNFIPQNGCVMKKAIV